MAFPNASWNGASALSLALDRSELTAFSALLQRGAAIPIVTGCSVQAFLTEQLGLDPAYVKDRVTTVFLDGKVIDDLDQTTLRDGARLALSAALPGLVGATFRGHGAYAAFRAGITASASADAQAPRTGGVVRVKLFNLLVEEIGPALLAHGVLLDKEETADVRSRCEALDRAGAAGPVLLRVSFA